MYWLLIDGCAKERRSEPRLSTGACTRRPLRRLPPRSNRLACNRTTRYVPPPLLPPLNPNPPTVSQLSTSLPLPISTKLRLCSPSTLTPELGKRIVAHGASWITLHARHVNARKRRAGPADLGVVRDLKEGLKGEMKVVSNGNVGTWEHIVKNLEETGADGVMVGETLLGNFWFASSESFELRPDPLLFS
jgi:hypothetical protein